GRDGAVDPAGTGRREIERQVQHARAPRGGGRGGHHRAERSLRWAEQSACPTGVNAGGTQPEAALRSTRRDDRRPRRSEDRTRCQKESTGTYVPQTSRSASQVSPTVARAASAS